MFQPYVAIDHVRDELLTPKERSSRDRMALWQRAVQFIRDRESRVSPVMTEMGLGLGVMVA